MRGSPLTWLLAPPDAAAGDAFPEEKTMKKLVIFHSKKCTPDKNNLFRKSNAWDNELRHENGCIKSSSQLRGEHCTCSSDFFPSECPGLCSTYATVFTRGKVGRRLTMLSSELAEQFYATVFMAQSIGASIRFCK